MQQANEFRKLIAIALKYKIDQDLAPKVIAKGKGEIAKKIIEKAKEHGIKIHKDEQLAILLSVLELNDYIPFQAYSAVAEIIAFLLKKNYQATARR